MVEAVCGAERQTFMRRFQVASHVKDPGGEERIKSEIAARQREGRSEPCPDDKALHGRFSFLSGGEAVHEAA